MKQLSIIGLILVLAGSLLLIGPLAWNYVAPVFSLPRLSVWQFFVAGVALRCLLGTSERSK